MHLPLSPLELPRSHFLSWFLNICWAATMIISKAVSLVPLLFGWDSCFDEVCCPRKITVRFAQSCWYHHFASPKINVLSLEIFFFTSKPKLLKYFHCLLHPYIGQKSWNPGIDDFPAGFNFNSFTFNFNKSFLKETMQQIKRCKANSYSNWSFDPIHSQSLVNTLPHPFCFIDIFCSTPHPPILWLCWSRYPIGLHSPANYFQWVGDRLAKESCTSTKKQSVKWI